MAGRAKSSAAQEAAWTAVQSIGLGYDLADDLRLKRCKQLRSSNSSASGASDPRLIAVNDSQVRSMVVPGGISIPNVPKSINCDKAERMRFSSDLLSFQQMSEQFNQELSLSGKIPSGHFNAGFDFSGSWQKDAANTKTLAFDGVFITLYNVALDKSQIVLRDQVKQAIPSSWDPAALARFIDTYGTHVIVGVKMGGKDVIYMKQQHSSPLQPADVQKKLKDMADKLFTEGPGPGSQNSNGRDRFSLKEQGIQFTIPSSSYSTAEIQDINFSCKRKGGNSRKKLPHGDWCQTVQLEPDVISMSFIPITSLLSGVHGSGFLSHAINLYLRYKSPIEELHQFLEFQLPRQWAPVFGELTLGPDRKKPSTASLQFSFMGPKLYVNTVPVDVGKRPVTGLRLYLEGKRSNCLALHLQHLSTQPKTFQLADEPRNNISHSSERKYYEKVQWKSFSHVCTAPVESDEDLSIVTAAHFEVGDSGLRKVLFLRWTCPSCGNVNFSFRTTCNMRNCTQPRPADHLAKSAVKHVQHPHGYSNAAPYLSPAPPSSMYHHLGASAPPYGSSISPYDVPFPGGPAYHYNYGSRLSAGSPYRPLHVPAPTPYSGGSMIGNGGMYGMPALMDRYSGFALPMSPAPVGLRPGYFPEDNSQKKDGSRDNDWMCPKCGNMNFSFRTVCNMRKCNTAKPGPQVSKSDKNSKKMPEGSWKCEKCNNINYPFRTKCNRQNCGADKPAESTKSPSPTSDDNDQ